MKKIIVVLVIALTTVACQNSKTGYVNTEELLTEYSELKEAKERFTQENESIQGELQLKIQAFEIKGKQYQTNAASMSREAQEEKYNELALEQQQLQNEQRTRVGELQVKSQTVIDSLIKKVKNKVKDYGKTNGYDFIYGSNDAGSVLYGKEELDLTDTILKELNAEVSKE